MIKVGKGELANKFYIVMEYLIIVHLINLCVLLMHQYQHLWYQYQQGMMEDFLEEDLAVVAGGSW